MSEANEAQSAAPRVKVQMGPNVALYPPGARFGPRRLSNWEFVWLLEGEAVYRFASRGTRPREEIALRVGDLLLCRHGERDEFDWDRNRPTRHGFFHFDIAWIPPSWPEIEAWPRVRRRGEQGGENSGESELFATLCRFVVTWGENGSETTRDAAAALLLSAFVTGESRVGELTPERLPEPVERALTYLHRQVELDPMRGLALADLARAACVSPEHLCRVFGKATGRTPLETVRLARLDRALFLLARTNYSGGQIARMLGFASPYHFSRLFSREFGRSPRALRQSLDRGEPLPASRLHRVAFKETSR